MAETNGVSLRVQTPMQPIGVSGLKQWSVVREEFLQELSGPVGVKTYMKMRDNSPIIGAILFASEMLLRPVGWNCTPADESQEAMDLASFASTRSLRTVSTPGMCACPTSSRCSLLAGPCASGR